MEAKSGKDGAKRSHKSRGRRPGRRVPPKLLQDFRLVNRSGGLEGPEQLRKRFADRYEWFIDRWTRLEQAFLASVNRGRRPGEGSPSREPQPDVVIDPGEKRAREQALKWLQENGNAGQG